MVGRTMNLASWALRWNVSPAALEELKVTFFGMDYRPATTAGLSGEMAALNEVRLEASRVGARLWRNNVGAGKVDGQFLRWGLANDSAQVNSTLKSADLIGIRPVFITQAHVGHTIGQFLSREIKAPGWRYKGTAREIAQLNWAQLIVKLGGDAGFATGKGTL